VYICAHFQITDLDQQYKKHVQLLLEAEQQRDEERKQAEVGYVNGKIMKFSWHEYFFNFFVPAHACE
jgi:hypothetical protein